MPTPNVNSNGVGRNLPVQQANQKNNVIEIEIEKIKYKAEILTKPLNPTR